MTTPAREHGTEREREVTIELPHGWLGATLAVSPRSRSLVLFAHGSGSSRFSPRNRRVAERLRRAGFSTLLLDLLTSEEEAVDARTAEFRFDVARLAERLALATDWARANAETRRHRMGYFGASTGAAAALIAAADRPNEVAAVVSRGGRPDLAGDRLESVRAPTLLIVGGNDSPVIELNRAALARMTSAEARIEIVPGATHLFPEEGALERVAQLAAEWFRRHLH